MPAVACGHFLKTKPTWFFLYDGIYANLIDADSFNWAPALKILSLWVAVIILDSLPDRFDGRKTGYMNMRKYYLS